MKINEGEVQAGTAKRNARHVSAALAAVCVLLLERTDRSGGLVRGSGTSGVTAPALVCTADDSTWRGRYGHSTGVGTENTGN